MPTPKLKYVRIPDNDTAKLVEKLTLRANKQADNHGRVYEWHTVKQALIEYSRNHPELGVKV